MNHAERKQRSKVTKAAVDAAVHTLSDARRSVNLFAAVRTHDQSARELLALAIGSHVIALQRLAQQLLTPVEEGEKPCR